MFTDNKNQMGNQLVDNTGGQEAQSMDSGMTSTMYTMPSVKQSNGSSSSQKPSSPKLMILIIAIIVIAIIGVGYWFYTSMSVPTDNLLIDDSFNTNALVPIDNTVAEPEEEIASTPSDRDQQRLDDISSVRSALAFYYQEMKAYPDILDDLLDKYLDSIPINPNPGGNSYIYVPQDSNQSYRLTFILEDGGALGALNLKAGEYQAGPTLIEPLVENVDNGDNVVMDTEEGIELLSGLDSDSDGLTDIEENLYKTNSTLVDSDEDGYSDASELVNLYDPSQAGVALADNTTVMQYINTAFNYSILYPSDWTVRALTEDKMEIIFNSKTTEFIQILILENPLGLSARNWYLNYNPDADETSLKEVVLNNMIGIQTASKRYTYLAVGSNIYSIIYNIGTTNQLNYQSTYEMMLNSWELITINESSPDIERDAQRLKDVTDIRFAILEYQVANLSLPELIDNDVDTYQMIGTTAEDCAVTCDTVSTITQCVNLSSVLIPDYLVSIPYDPLDGTELMSNYYLNVLTDGTLIAGACQAEGENNIEVNN